MNNIINFIFFFHLFQIYFEHVKEDPPPLESGMCLVEPRPFSLPPSTPFFSRTFFSLFDQFRMNYFCDAPPPRTSQPQQPQQPQKQSEGQGQEEGEKKTEQEKEEKKEMGWFGEKKK